MSYLEMHNITKTFPGVVANDNVDLTVERGKIHGLVGENGAGKTTLMRILYGMYTPDSGRILLEGEEIEIPDPQAAIDRGIGMVHQDFQLVPSLTVAQNIALGQEPKRGIFVDTPRIRARVRELSEQFGLQVAPDAVVSDLSIGVQQRVEILKLLYREARLLILDEPTAVLTPQEVSALFDVLVRLTSEGYTIIFITHKLDEVMAVCRRATVLRRGEITGVVETESSSAAEIARLMVGHDIETVERQPKREYGPDALVVEGLRARDDRGVLALRSVNVTVRAGEIVGIATLKDITEFRWNATRSDADRHLTPEEREEARRLRMVIFEEMGKVPVEVRDIMTPIVLSVDEKTPVRDIANIMMREHLHRIFVTSDSKITGIITTYDMLKVISDEGLTQRCADND